MTDNFSQEARERHTLVHEINNLKQLNEQMAREAVNLTLALKGDNKAQGNWGEVVLARVLSESGLREGHEYQTQISLKMKTASAISQMWLCICLKTRRWLLMPRCR